MVLASFRTPGEFGGLAPLVDEAGKLDLNLDSYARFFTETSTCRSSSSRSWYAALTTLICLLLAYPLATLIAKSPQQVPRPAAAARHPAVLEQFPDPRLRVDDHPRPATPRWRARSTACSAWFGAEPVPLLFSSFAVLVCLVYVHLPFMVLPLYANLEKHDQALLDAAQDLGANALAAVLAHHVPAVAAGRLRGRRAGVHSGARHLRDSRHPRRARTTA